MPRSLSGVRCYSTKNVKEEVNRCVHLVCVAEVSINLIDFDVGTIFADPRYRRPSQWSAEARHRYVRHLLKRLLLPLLSLLLVTAAITLGFLLPWAYRLFVVSLWYSAYSLMILYTFHVVVWKQREQ